MRWLSLAVLLGGSLAAMGACSSSSKDGKGFGNVAPAPDGVTADSGSPSSKLAVDGSIPKDAAPPPPPLPPPIVTTTLETMMVEGTPRSYYLAIPTMYDASKAYPLVMVLHGNPGHASDMVANLPFDGASKQDAIIAYPEGLGGNWDLSTPVATNSDVAFLKVLAAEIHTKLNVDLGRAFLYGYSGGAFFANQLVCRVSGVVKAFASVAGGAPYPLAGEPNNNGACLSCPGGSTPTIHIHGRQDDTVGRTSGSYAANCWGVTNGCTALDSNTWGPVAPPPCQKAPGCDANPVEFCWVEGVTHYPPWSEATLTAWRFFRSLP